MTAASVNTAAPSQVSSSGGGKSTAAASGDGEGFVSLLDQLFAATAVNRTESGTDLAGLTSDATDDEALASGEDVPAWLQALTRDGIGGTNGIAAVDDAPEGPADGDALSDLLSGRDTPPDGTDQDPDSVNAILAGLADPSMARPATAQQAAEQTAAGSTTTQTPSPDKPGNVAHLAAELAATATARQVQADAAAEETASRAAQAGAGEIGDADLDALLASLGRKGTTPTLNTGQPAAGHAEAEQLARITNPAAQDSSGESRRAASKLADQIAGEPGADTGDKAGKPAARDTDPLARLLAANTADRIAPGSGQGAAAAAGDGLGFKPGNAPTLLTINEIGTGISGMTGTATQTAPGVQTAVPAQAAQPNMDTLAVRIARNADNGRKSFEIQLDPPELGRVEVKLEFARDGRVTTHLTVDRADTLDALQRDARGLERALQAQGFKLEDGGIQYHLRDQSAFAQHQQGGGATPDQSGPNDELADGADLDPDTATEMAGVRRQIAVGGLDLRI